MTILKKMVFLAWLFLLVLRTISFSQNPFELKVAWGFFVSKGGSIPVRYLPIFGIAFDIDIDTDIVTSSSKTFL